MSFWKWGQCLAVLVLIGLGCGSADRPDAKATPPPAPSKTNAPAANGSPTKAQPKLQTIKLWVGAEEIIAEIAITEIQIQTGMMHRTKMAENEGMIFIFGAPHQASFWMRNTVLPLSGAYIDPDGIILEIHAMKPLDETAIPAGSNRVQYVLEMNQGWFDRRNIKPGALIRTERGSLAQTFLGRNP